MAKADLDIRYAKDHLDPDEAFVYNRRNHEIELWCDWNDTGGFPRRLPAHSVRKVKAYQALLLRRQFTERVRFGPRGDEVMQCGVAIRFGEGYPEADDDTFGEPLEAPKPEELLERPATARQAVVAL